MTSPETCFGAFILRVFCFDVDDSTRDEAIYFVSRVYRSCTRLKFQTKEFMKLLEIRQFKWLEGISKFEGGHRF